MNIEIILWGQLKEKAGKTMSLLEIDKNANLASVISKLSDDYSALGELLYNDDGSISKSVLIFLNGEQIPADSSEIIAEGSSLALMPPIAGG